MEIIGVGYSKTVEIGESFLQHSVVSMWDIPDKGTFIYYDGRSRFVLEEVTRKSEKSYSVKTLKLSDITDEIRVALLNKGYSLLEN